MRITTGEKIEKVVKELGGVDFDSYWLVNNYGYTFQYQGKKYDFRHWRNVYGAEVDYWDLTPGNKELNDKLQEVVKENEE